MRQYFSQKGCRHRTRYEQPEIRVSLTEFENGSLRLSTCYRANREPGCLRPVRRAPAVIPGLDQVDVRLPELPAGNGEV